jgi:hypothetical protein
MNLGVIEGEGMAIEKGGSADQSGSGSRVTAPGPSPPENALAVTPVVTYSRALSK